MNHTPNTPQPTLDPVTVLWALGNPDGWRTSHKTNRGVPCIEAICTLTAPSTATSVGCTRTLKTLVPCEHPTLDGTLQAMRSAVRIANDVLAQAAARELKLLPVVGLGGRRFMFDCPSAEAERVLGELRALCVFGGEA